MLKINRPAFQQRIIRMVGCQNTLSHSYKSSASLSATHSVLRAIRKPLSFDVSVPG